MRVAILAAAAALVLAGCGGSKPRLARADANPLIALTSRIAHEGGCAQARDIAALRTRSLRLINQRHVPAELQEPFLSGVNALGDQTPVCVPTVTPAPTSPPPKPGKGRGKGHGKDHEHGNGNGE